ncbi:hypothetical protein [Foetidibacter luteolus]|uniref:hypothetical protein n=1 Tax=Foetidibacter luteolus TaxID=2608880 RepID=UPI00129ADAC4|nr:hypothetical protein [Foetidibacter luteolus]
MNQTMKGLRRNRAAMKNRTLVSIFFSSTKSRLINQLEKLVALLAFLKNYYHI